MAEKRTASGIPLPVWHEAQRIAERLLARSGS